MKAPSHLDHVRREHLRAVDAAAAAGIPPAELLHDLAGFHSAARQLLAMLEEPTLALPRSVVTEPAR